MGKILYLSEVRDFIAGLLTNIVDDEHVYSGIMEDKQEMSVGVYNQKRGTPKLTAVGANPSYSRKAVSVLVHWNKSPKQTERAAAAVYAAIESAGRTKTGTNTILFVKMTTEEAVDVGTDDNGVFEMVIEFDIYYERQDTE